MADQVGLINFKGGDGEKSKALEKLIDVVARGTDKLFVGPMGKWLDGKAEASTIKTLSRARTDAEIERLKKFKEAFGEEDSDVLLRALALAESHQSNLDEIGEKALKYITGPVPDKPIDPDWKNDFADKAKNISNSDVQETWARLLVGEITQPGSTSKRTMNVLYTLNSAEARLFEKLCSVIFTDLQQNIALLYLNQQNQNIYAGESEADFAIGFNTLIILSECGLVNSLQIGYSLREGATLAFGRNAIEFPPNKFFGFDGYKLTQAGFDLYKILNIDFDPEFFKRIANENFKIFRPLVSSPQ